MFDSFSVRSSALWQDESYKDTFSDFGIQFTDEQFKPPVVSAISVENGSIQSEVRIQPAVGIQSEAGD